ncbi:uncharacterized protein LOC113336773 [Papaver somniferum]|uniref:uncharacterized protein LOC113336773 n=1 Tax=Papaver somniferum TaxID=3469 RepID=UPI000E6FC4C4|nr:uncharacterized protein LOC113336773 [Papaver somniferum]
MPMKKMELTVRKLKFKDWIIIPFIGKSGGQIIAWFDNLDVQLIEIQQNIITVTCKVRGILCYTSCLYGALNSQQKYDQWEYIQSLGDLIVHPWMIVGDLNFVHNSEKEGGNDMKSSAIIVIQNVIQQIGFIDLKFTSDPFTWSSQREGEDNTRERIDRSLDGNKNVFKNIFKNKEMVLKRIDKENAKLGHLISRKKLKVFEEELETWSKIENIYWLENSRDKFFKEHDGYTKYFHVVASNRKRHYNIHSLRDITGLWLEDKDQLDALLKNHFQGISSSE